MLCYAGISTLAPNQNLITKLKNLSQFPINLSQFLHYALKWELEANSYGLNHFESETCPLNY